MALSLVRSYPPAMEALVRADNEPCAMPLPLVDLLMWMAVLKLPVVTSWWYVVFVDLLDYFCWCYQMAHPQGPRQQRCRWRPWARC